MNGKSWENAIVWDLQLVFGGDGSSEAISEALMTVRPKAISAEGGNASSIPQSVDLAATLKFPRALH